MLKSFKEKILLAEGLAVLETALLFVVFLPLLLASFAYLSKNSLQHKLDKLIADTFVSSPLQPLRMHTGDQEYFVRLKFNLSGKPSEKAKATRAEFKQEINELLNRTEHQIIKMIPDCATSCSDRYKIELRFLKVRIDPDDGKATHWSSKDLKRDEEFKYLRGTLAHKLGSAWDRTNEAVGFSKVPFPYAIPSGLFGVEHYQDYGRSFQQDNKGEEHYLRVSIIMSILAVVDINDSASGKLLQLFSLDDQESAGLISSFRVAGPRLLM